MNHIIYRHIKCGIIRQNRSIFKLWFLLPSQILRCIVVDVMFIDASPKSRWIEKTNKCNLRKLRSFMEFKSVRMNGPFSFKHKTIFKPGEGRVDINNFLACFCVKTRLASSFYLCFVFLSFLSLDISSCLFLHVLPSVKIFLRSRYSHV